ncbi:MAG: YqgE/AlgH family protein [Granulosicoccus sp.]
MNLTHHFLVSMPQMQDDCFRNSVIYVLDHGEQGAFGVVINHALGMDFESLLAQIDIKLDNESARNATVLRGGPVDEDHGLVLHEPGPGFDTTRNFPDGVSLSSSRDVLEAIARGDEPSTYLVVLGHSGWAPGQLEMEVVKNSWLTCTADTDILFRTPIKDRRQAVASLIGVDMSNLVGHSGHA